MNDKIDTWNSGLAYLATPYTKYKTGIEQAFIDSAKLAGLLLRCGVKCYSPITHCHAIAMHGKINPLDHSIWLPFDEAMMKAADALIVAHMDGWQESFGIAHEIKVFEDAGKPIFDLDPKTLTMTRRHGPFVYEPDPHLASRAHKKSRSEHAGTNE